MALPADVGVFTLTGGSFTDVTGATALAGMKGTLTPVDGAGRPMNVVHAASGKVIVPIAVPIEIQSDGTWSLGPLPYTDDSHLASPFRYKVSWNAAGSAPSPGNKIFEVPTGSGTTIDFDLLGSSTGTLVTPVAVPLVTSVAGQSGAVTSTQIAAAMDTDGTRLSDASLRAAFDARDGAGNTIVFLGDSITASGDGNQLPGVRWPEIVSMRSMGRIRWAHNAGIGGNTTAQMLARLSTDVLAYKPRFCTVLGGTNDADAPTAISGLTSLYTQLRQAGVEPIALTMPPQNSDPGGKACVVNAWIKRYAEAHRITVVDLYPLLVDPTTGNYTTGLDKDGTHPNAAGDDKIATAVLNAIEPMFRNWGPYLAPSQVDTANLCPNPCLVDTRLAGDGVTQIPQDPLHWASSPGGATTVSMVSQSGVPGRMQQLVVASTETAGTSVNMTHADGTDDYPIAVTPGHTIRFSMRVQTQNALTNGVAFGAFLQFGGEGSYHGVNSGGNAYGEVTDGVWSMDVLVPTGATGARIGWGCSAPATPTSTTTLRFGQPTVVDLGVV